MYILNSSSQLFHVLNTRAARVTRFVTFVSRGIKITGFLIGLRKFIGQVS